MSCRCQRVVIKNRLIICIASSWDYDPTGKHHIMRILSRRNRVLWVNYHGTRRPGGFRGDLAASARALRRVLRGPTRVSESITQITPLVIPGSRSRPARILHERLLLRQLHRAVSKIPNGRRSPIQVWSFAPDVPCLIGAFGEERFVYCCVDEFAEFAGVDGPRIQAAENETIRRADVVITTSAALHRKCLRKRPDAALVPHGVDFDHFARSWKCPPDLPTDLRDIPRPMFGYMGVIHDWVDMGFLADVARLRPAYSFVMIGEPKVSTAAVDRLPNVHLLGRRPYAHLPSYCAAFSAGIMLFRQSHMTRSVNPIKMWEYLAAGLPVVSTPLPEAQRFRGLIRIAGRAADFARRCDDVVQGNPPISREAISRHVHDVTWEARVDQLCQLVEADACRTIGPAGSKDVSEIRLNTGHRVHQPVH